MYKLMFSQFLRTRTCMLGLSLLLVLGVIGILIGKQFLNVQQEVASQVAEKQADHIDRNVKYHSDDLGLLLYYLEFALINEPSQLAGLSIGQRDINPSVQSVTIRTLEAQKYDTDLLNPVKLLYGNLDLSFVLIYVLPLLIIAFTYNLWSEEEETGTWRLVSVMVRSKLKFLLAKLTVRFVLLFSLILILFVLAGIVLDISWNLPFLAFFVTSVLYLIFWFSLSFWIISLRRNSNFNALTLLFIWLTLVVLVPSALNSYINAKYPVPEALTSMITQRDGYHKKWDTNKRNTVEKFFESYPQFEKFGYPPEDGFNWLWYYAMQHLGDVESNEASTNMRKKIIQREEISKEISRFVPTMHTQLVLNDFAGTGLTNHMDFSQSTDDFHERIRLFFYPRIFSKERAEAINWKQFEPEFLSANTNPDWIKCLAPLVVGILIFSGLGLGFHMKSYHA